MDFDCRSGLAPAAFTTPTPKKRKAAAAACRAGTPGPAGAAAATPQRRVPLATALPNELGWASTNSSTSTSTTTTTTSSSSTSGGGGGGGGASDPLPLPAVALPTASYAKIWARPSQETSSPHYVEALVGPESGLAYIKVRDIHPSGTKPVYLCVELGQDAQGVYVPTARGEVVIKAARLQPHEYEALRTGHSQPPSRIGADEPSEEARVMLHLSMQQRHEAAAGGGGGIGVVPLLDCFLDDDRWLYLVTPYYPRGDLVEVLSGVVQQRGLLQVPAFARWARDIFSQLLAALATLKRAGVAHLDLSPENVFLDAEGARAYLADFGMSLFVGARDDNEDHDQDESEGEGDCIYPRTPAKVCCTGAGIVEGELPAGAASSVGGRKQHRRLLTPQRFRGKVAYASPELLAEEPFDPFAADIFALGCTLFSLLTGRLLLEPAAPGRQATAASARPRFDALLRGDFATLFDTQDPASRLPLLATDLLTGMLQPDPRQRLTLEEVLVHPWVRHQRG